MEAHTGCRPLPREPAPWQAAGVPAGEVETFQIIF